MAIVKLLQPESSPNNTASPCAQVVPYSGQICTNHLTSLKSCFSGASPSTSPLNVPSDIDQQLRERNAAQLLNEFNTSLECSEEIQPFLCLHMFGLCDASGNLHTSSRGECLRLRDTVCSSEWARAVSLLPSGNLPVCEDLLSNTTDQCTGN